CFRIRRPYTISVNDRISSYTIVFSPYTTRRNTIVILSHVNRQNTIVYGKIRNVYGRLRVYTDFVFLDLGNSKIFHRYLQLSYYQQLFRFNNGRELYDLSLSIMSTSSVL